MIAAVIFLAASCVALAGALTLTVRSNRVERTMLLEVVISKHAADYRAIRREAHAESVDAAEAERQLSYEQARNRDLELMGFDPKDVPRVPAGLG